MANLWLDPGQIYVIGEYEIGNSTPTGAYKIGMVQNESTSAGRLDGHQTGNPNRLFLEKTISVEATYLVEQLMHTTWRGNRIALEWFEFSAAELTQVENDIRRLDAQQGPGIVRLRNVYYTAPNPGMSSSLTATQIIEAERLRDQAYDICKEMIQLKYTSGALMFEILLTNGLNAAVDCVTKLKVESAYTEFNPSLLPAPLKLQYKTKPMKRKDDFRFKFTATGSRICELKPESSHWKGLFPTEEAAFKVLKDQWTTMKTTITPTTVNTNVQQRTATIQRLHTEYTEQIARYESLDKKKKTIELQLKLLCYDHEEITNVCEWKRKTQSNEFNVLDFKVNDYASYIHPNHQAPKGDTAKPTVIKYKAWQ